jgi:predicted transcriptional regulator
MTIVINLTPEVEAQLREKAVQRGEDVSIVAAQMLAKALESEAQDLREAIEGIQRGLNDFEAGNFRSFNDFAEEKRRKYNLPAD